MTLPHYTPQDGSVHTWHVDGTWTTHQLCVFSRISGLGSKGQEDGGGREGGRKREGGREKEREEVHVQAEEGRVRVSGRERRWRETKKGLE